MATCYCDVLRLAARKISARYDAALESTGLSIAQFALLRKIQRAAQPSLTEIGRRAGLDRSTVGRNVRVLVKAGLVEFVAAKDQREATVRLTEKGVATLSGAEPLWAMAQADIEAALGEDAAERLRALADAL
jgi:DNA-binding MarR family transcriptional regulator